MEDWLSCKNILCIRADNMGDLIMSTPAISALKTSIGAKITVLTSAKASGITSMMREVDEVMVADLPWVKLGDDPGPQVIQELTSRIRSCAFDGCIIFSVYSQNSLPAAMLAYLAGIPLRLAYAKENPYHLLTSWMPDAEPYCYIRHQVERDLELVRSIGATIQDEHLRLDFNPKYWDTLKQQAIRQGINPETPYLLLHPGVSEEKRKYPEELWVLAGKLLLQQTGMQLLLTGSQEERGLTDVIAGGIGADAFSVAGLFSLEEFALLVKHAQLVVSVNTATVHLAAAAQTPVVVLYAQTNPQHTPWLVPNRVLEFSVPPRLTSKNQIICYVNDQYYTRYLPPPTAQMIVNAVSELLRN